MDVKLIIVLIAAVIIRTATAATNSSSSSGSSAPASPPATGQLNLPHPGNQQGPMLQGGQLNSLPFSGINIGVPNNQYQQQQQQQQQVQQLQQQQQQFGGGVYPQQQQLQQQPYGGGGGYQQQPPLPPPNYGGGGPYPPQQGGGGYGPPGNNNPGYNKPPAQEPQTPIVPKLTYESLVEDGCGETPQSSCTALPTEIYTARVQSRVCSEFFVIDDQQFMFVAGVEGELSEVHSFDPTGRIAVSVNVIDSVFIEGRIKDCKAVTVGPNVFLFVATVGVPSYIFVVERGVRPGSKNNGLLDSPILRGNFPQQVQASTLNADVPDVWLREVQRLHHNGLNDICIFGQYQGPFVAFSNWDAECDILSEPYCGIAPLYYWDGIAWRFATHANILKSVSCAAWETYDSKYVTFVERDIFISSLSRILTFELSYEFNKYFLRPVVTDYSKVVTGGAVPLIALEKLVHPAQLVNSQTGGILKSGRLCDVTQCRVITIAYEFFLVCAIDTNYIEDGDWDNTRIDLSQNGRSLHHSRESACLLSPQTMWVARWNRDTEQWVDHQCVNDADGIDVVSVFQAPGCCPLIITCDCCECCKLWSFECIAPTSPSGTIDGKPPTSQPYPPPVGQPCTNKITRIMGVAECVLPAAVNNVRGYSSLNRNFVGLSSRVNTAMSPVWEIVCNPYPLGFGGFGGNISFGGPTVGYGAAPPPLLIPPFLGGFGGGLLGGGLLPPPIGAFGPGLGLGLGGYGLGGGFGGGLGGYGGRGNQTYGSGGGYGGSGGGYRNQTRYSGGGVGQGGNYRQQSGIGARGSPGGASPYTGRSMG